MCGCIPLPSWAGGNARDDTPPTRRQERERYAEELRRDGQSCPDGLLATC